MNGFNSTRNLLEKAAAEYEDGKRKDAYSKYVAALNTLLFKLSGNKVIFMDSGDEPNAKVKELLEGFQIAHDCLYYAENVILDRPIHYREKPEKKSRRKKKRSRQRDGSTMATDANESNAEEKTSSDEGTSSSAESEAASEGNNVQGDAKDAVAERVLVRVCDEHDEDDEHTVPLIPLSPLCRMYIVNTRRLAKSTRELTAAKGSRKDRNKTATSLAVLRRLDEDMRIQRAKVDDVTAQIKAIQDKTMLDWDPDQLARQWCIIDAALFAKVDVRRDLITTLAESERVGRIFGDSVEACVDFERYVNSAVAHLLIIGAEEFRPGEMVIRVARTAHRLLHRYRNLNAFAGLMRALVCAPVRRLDRAWQDVPNRVRRLIQEYARALEPVALHRRYMMLLHESLDDRRNDMGSNTGMALIPWMRPHCDIIRAWLRAYTTQRETRIMSELGMKKLDAMHSTLEVCQKYAGGVNNDKVEHNNGDAIMKPVLNGMNRFDNPSISRMGPRRRRGFIELDGTQLHLPAIGDLATLTDSDLGLQHWLSSRVYLTRAQLWEESIQVKPAGPGERMPSRDAYRFIDDRGKYAEDDVPESGERGTTGRKRGLQAAAEIRKAWQGTAGSVRERPVSMIGQAEAILSPRATSPPPSMLTAPAASSTTERPTAEELAKAMANAETAVNVDGSLMTVDQMLSFLEEEPAQSPAQAAAPPSEDPSTLPLESFVDEQGRDLVDIAREEVLKRLATQSGFETIRDEVKRLTKNQATNPTSTVDVVSREATPKLSSMLPVDDQETTARSGAATPVPRRRPRASTRVSQVGHTSDPEDSATPTRTARAATVSRSRPQTMYAELERLALNRESEAAWLAALQRQANEASNGPETTLEILARIDKADETLNRVKTGQVDVVAKSTNEEEQNEAVVDNSEHQPTELRCITDTNQLDNNDNNDNSNNVAQEEAIAMPSSSSSVIQGMHIRPTTIMSDAVWTLSPSPMTALPNSLGAELSRAFAANTPTSANPPEAAVSSEFTDVALVSKETTAIDTVTVNVSTEEMNDIEATITDLPSHKEEEEATTTLNDMATFDTVIDELITSPVKTDTHASIVQNESASATTTTTATTPVKPEPLPTLSASSNEPSLDVKSNNVIVTPSVNVPLPQLAITPPVVASTTSNNVLNGNEDNESDIMSDEIMEEVSFAVSEELSAIYSNDIDDDNDGDDDDDDDYLDGLPLNISLKNLQAAQGLDYSESEASSDGEAISFIAHSREHSFLESDGASTRASSPPHDVTLSMLMHLTQSSQISEVTLVSDEETIHGNSNNDHSNDNHSSSNTTKTNVVNNKNVTISNSVLDDKMTKTKLPSNNTAIATTTTTTPTSYPPTHGHHRARSIATESARQNHFQMARQFQHNRSQSSSAKSMDGITIQMEGKRVTFREPNPLHPSLRKSSTSINSHPPLSSVFMTAASDMSPIKVASPLSSSSSSVAVQQQQQSSILPAVASPPRQRQPRSHMVHQSIDETAASLSSNTVQQSHPSQNDNSNGNNNGKNKNNQKSRQRGRGRNQRRNQRRNQQRGGGQQQQQQQHSQQTQVVHG